MQDVLLKVIQFASVLFAISIHESSHAWTAYRCGDPTAKIQGRITLNPIPHIDLIGTIIFPLILALARQPVFGWAKPVMVNPYNFRHPRRDTVLVSVAGPLSNILAGSASIILYLILDRVFSVTFVPLLLLLQYLIVINIYLAVFNLIPIPPLDGSGIIDGFLRGDARRFYERIKPYGFLILLAIIYLNLLHYVADPIFTLVESILR